MPCYKPLQGFLSKSINPKTHKRGVVFNRRDGFCDKPILVPCGQCIGCRLERSRQWAVRCVHEASLHDSNCFITVTYSDDHLPSNRTLVKKDFQLFMKRLRKRFGKMKFFMCGEYGELNKRPHYHALLFGFDFPDRVTKINAEGRRYVESELLNETWGLGYCSVGDVTFDSAAYVARYIVDKLNISKGSDAEARHDYFVKYFDGDISTGEIYGERIEEYTTMSRGGRDKGSHGIAYDWYKKYTSDVYPCDEVVVKGFPSRPPRYYDNQFELDDPSTFRSIKNKRKKRCDNPKIVDNNTYERLQVREVVATAKLNKKRRVLHD